MPTEGMTCGLVGAERTHRRRSRRMPCCSTGVARERGVIIPRNITKTLPRTLVTVLAPCTSSSRPDAGKIVWVGDSLGVLVPGDDACSHRRPRGKAIADHVHRVHSTAAVPRPGQFILRNGMKEYCSRYGLPARRHCSSVCGIRNKLAVQWHGCRRSEDDVCRLRIVLEVSEDARMLHGGAIIGHVFRQTQGDDVAGHRSFVTHP